MGRGDQYMKSKFSVAVSDGSKGHWPFGKTVKCPECSESVSLCSYTGAPCPDQPHTACCGAVVSA